MPCCLQSKDKLGQTPEWLQRRFIQALFSLPQDLNNRIVDLIGNFAGHLVCKDPPKRVGDLCFENTHNKWRTLTADGRLKLNATDRARANKQTGSYVHSPLFVFQAIKQNAGFMHTPSGHITHFCVLVSDSIRTKMKDCEWMK